jgi:predicted DNA-binding protein
MQEQVITISAQIPSHLDKGLTMICEMEERSKSYFIKKALEMLLKEKLEDVEDYQKAKKAYDDFKKSKQKAIPYEKIKKKYKL